MKWFYLWPRRNLARWAWSASHITSVVLKFSGGSRDASETFTSR